MYENGPKKKIIFSLWFHQHEFRSQPLVFWEYYNFVRVLSVGFSRTPPKMRPLTLFPYHSHKNPYRYGTGMGPIIGSPWNHPWYAQLWEAAGGSPALRTAVAKHLERSRRVGAAWRVKGEGVFFPSSAMKKGVLVGICLVSIRVPGRLQWRKPGWLGCIGTELLPSLCHEMRIPFWTQQFDI